MIARLDVEARQDRSEDRPTPDTWSAREYVSHGVDMVGEALVAIREGRAEPRVEVENLQRAITQTDRLLQELAGSALDRLIELGNAFPATPRWMLLHRQHDLEHHLLDIKRGWATLHLAASAGPTVQR